MKLTIEHLAPYLPYGLKAENCLKKIVEIKGLHYGSDSVSNELWIFQEETYMRGYLYECKPILRPLSDLTIEDAYHCDYPDEGHLERSLQSGHAPYFVWLELVKEHFDVFGLIEKGLAIDINTLDP